jgi:PAS domain S-box-containing protein
VQTNPVGSAEVRKLGIDVVGDVPWGTHFCQFYQTKEDLIDILVPYFKVGLENNEFCMWVTAEPLEVAEAKKTLRKTVKGYAKYVKNGQIEIISYKDWYVNDGKFDSDRVLTGWVSKLEDALGKGFSGLRLTGNTFWLETNNWEAFADYEAEVNRVIGNYQMIAICTYCLDKCDANEIIDVVKNHQFAIIKRRGEWELIQSFDNKRIADELEMNRKKLTSLYSSMVEGVALHDMLYDDSGRAVDYVITDVNPSFEKITGLTRSKAIGRRASELYGTGKPPYLDIYAGVASSGEPIDFETYFAPMKKQFSISVFSPEKGKFNTVFHDITVRKTTEETLIESERRWSTTLSSIGDAVIVTDPLGNVTFMNKVAENLTGWSLCDASDKPVRQVFNIVNRFTRQEVEDPVAKVLKKGLIVGLANHTILIRRDGMEIPINDSGAPIRTENGETLGVVLVFRDITQQKEQEEALRASEENYRLLLQYAPTAIYEIDYKGPRFKSVNEAMCQLTGYSREELLSMNPSDLLDAESRQRFQERIAKGLSGKRIDDSVEFTAITKEGRRLWITLNIKFTYANGKLDGALVVGHDITDRKKAEQESERLLELVKQERDRLSSLVNSISDEVWFANTDRKFTLINPSAVREFKLGQSDRSVDVENLAASLEVYRPDGSRRPVDEAPPLRALKGEVVKDQEEMIRSPVRGELRYRQVSAAPVRDSNGSIIGSVSVVRDITERKEAEEQLRIASKLPEENPNPVLRVSREGKILFINPAASRVLSAWGLQVGKQAPERMLPIVNDAFDTSSKKEFEENVGGRVFSFVVAPITDAGYVNIYGMDLTERKLAETKLAEQALMLASANDAIIGYDMDHKVRFWNKAAENLYGYALDEAIGMISHVLLTPTYINTSEEDLINRVMEIGHSEIESVRRTKDGRELLIESHVILLRDESGKPEGFVAVDRDITERKRAEEALRESEQRMNRAQEIAHLGSWELDLTNNHLTWSDEVYRLFGLKPQEFASTYEAFLEVVHPDDRAAVDSAYSGSLREGKDSYEINHRIVRPDGEVRFMHERCEHKRDSSGKIVRSVGMVQDITELKASEKALRQHAEELGFLSNTAVKMIEPMSLPELYKLIAERIYSVTDGALVIFNEFDSQNKKMVIREFMCSPQEREKVMQILGREPTGLALDFVEETRTRMVPGQLSLVEGGLHDIAFRQIPADDCQRLEQELKIGDIFAMCCSMGEEILGTIAVLTHEHDLLPRKRLIESVVNEACLAIKRNKTEETLRETRDYLDSLLNYANAPIIVWDPEFSITMFNHAFERLTGYDSAAVKGKKLDILFPEDKKKAAIEHIERTLRGEYWETVEIPIQHIDGTIKTLLWNSANVHDQNGLIVATIAQGHDVTERKQIELKVEEYAKHLEQLVEQRTNQLKAAERLATIGQTATMIGHDIRNPLQVIVGYIDLMKMDLDDMPEGTDKSKMQSSLAEVEKQVLYVNKIIFDLQDFTKTMKPVCEEFDLKNLINELVTQTSIPDSIAMQVNVDDDARKLTTDATHVRRILGNLVLNAIQAMPTGGSLTIEARRDQNNTTITVEDTGVGIPGENTDKIFQPLFTTKSKGQGLGLAVVKRLTEAIDGKITFSSKQGKGTKFTIMLPSMSRSSESNDPQSKAQ